MTRNASYHTKTPASKVAIDTTMQTGNHPATMNQDQVKQKLLKLETPEKDFSVIFSGKESRKVDGLYKPDTCEIVLHNRNFDNENELVYTAIHEFAHHIHFTSSTDLVFSKAHTTAFWDIFHRLLDLAEEKGVYQNTFRVNPEFAALTRTIKERFLAKNGELMKDFGAYLIKAFELCARYHVSFDDYMDRELNLHRSSAKTIMKFSSLDLNPAIGYENMKIVAGIRDPVKLRQAERAFLEGKSPDTVKREFKSPTVDTSELDHLISEKKRLAASIDRLKRKLDEIEHLIEKKRSEA